MLTWDIYSVMLQSNQKALNPLLHRYTFIVGANSVYPEAVWSGSTLFALDSLCYFWPKCDRSRSDGMKVLADLDLHWSHTHENAKGLIYILGTMDLPFYEFSASLFIAHRGVKQTFSNWIANSADPVHTAPLSRPIWVYTSRKCAKHYV
jgi:hypothetical protein